MVVKVANLQPHLRNNIPVIPQVKVDEETSETIFCTIALLEGSAAFSH